MNSQNPLTSSPPSSDQLSAARLQQWHQNGEALLTFENLRSWINVAGLALYSPRAAQLPVPAPSMVEAVLGAPNSAPAPAAAEQARSLLARLIAEGAVVPLNLFGSPTGAGTETPDFIAATAVLPYVFTLRGDKNWKQPPTTTGAFKVSPLALAAYNHLAERSKSSIPGLSAAALASDLGKEVTETGVLRALTELWQHLRVLPIPQPDGAATLWELTSARFTRQLKAGANAGQPSALSALISLYLGQALAATEADIETFLSPLTARSRIREVIHALLSARQLETLVIEGKTLLHVAGSVPAFLSAAAPVASETAALSDDTPPSDDIDSFVVTTEGDEASAGEQSRIKKFIPRPRKVGTGFVPKPGLDKPARKPFVARSPQDDHTRRPFNRSSDSPVRSRPAFNKPWEEERTARLAAASRPSRVPDDIAAQAGEESAPSAPAFKPRRSDSSKPSFDRRREGGFTRDSRPPRPSRDNAGYKKSFPDKPAFNRDRSDSRPPRRDFKPRPAADSAGSGDFAPRKRTFSKPGTFGRKREGGFSPRPRFEGGKDSSASRREFTPRPARDRDSRPPRRDFAPREAGSEESPRPRYRKFDAPRSPRSFKSDRPFNPDRPARSFDPDRPARPKRSFTSDRAPRPFDPGRPASGKPKKSAGDQGKSASFGDRKPYGKSKSSGGYAGKSSGGYAGKSSKSGGSFAGKPFSSGKKKSFGKPKFKSESAGRSDKPASTFDKFKNNTKPFGKRPPARKWKPSE